MQGYLCYYVLKCPSVRQINLRLGKIFEGRSNWKQLSAFPLLLCIPAGLLLKLILNPVNLTGLESALQPSWGFSVKNDGYCLENLVNEPKKVSANSQGL